MLRGGLAVFATLLLAAGCNLPPTACGDDSLTLSGNSVGAAPTANGLDINFGNVNLGTSLEQFFSIDETCGHATVSSISFTGSPDFSLVLGADAGYAYEPYEDAPADAILFQASTIGAFSATVTFTTTSHRTPTLVLTLKASAVAPGPTCNLVSNGDSDCDGQGFCDGTYCQPNACQAFNNVPAGDAGTACAPQNHACPGTNGLILTDTLSDPNNCGGCGQVCPLGHGCANAHCGFCPSYRIGAEQDFLLSAASSTGSQFVNALSVGDFDGDGFPDVLIAADFGVSGNAALLINDGEGGFGAAPRFLNLCDTPLTLADFNGDCALDVLAGGTVMLNNGHGNFPVRNNLPDAPAYAYLANNVVDDFNQDGFPDVLGASALLLGDGRGNFQPASVQPTGLSGALAMSVADFGGNGRPDLIAYQGTPSPTFVYYFNDGGGDLAFETDYFPTSSSSSTSDSASIEPQALLAAPLTGGISSSIVFGQPGALTALPNPAVGSAGAALLLLDGGYQAFALAAADLDLDGNADVLAVGPRADGGFLDAWTKFSIDAGQLSADRFQSITTRAAPGFVAVADVNGDGIPDIVAASPSSVGAPGVPGHPTVMVFLGSCP